MHPFKFVRNQIILWGVLCAAGYVAYQVLLDDEAKASIAELTGTVRGSYQQLTGIVNERIGTIMDEDLVEQNRQKIREDWADLGF